MWVAVGRPVIGGEGGAVVLGVGRPVIGGEGGPVVVGAGVGAEVEFWVAVVCLMRW